MAALSNRKTGLICLGLAGVVFSGIGLAGTATVCAQSGTKTAQPTPDPYFKTKPAETKWSQPYTPPNFSSDQNSVDRFASKSKSGDSISWGDRRSIVNEKSAAPQETLPGDRLASLDSDDSQREEKQAAFEPGRVVAVVGGEPIFVGDMMFESSQLIEKFMPTAPQKIKDEQRKELIKKLVKKYVDAKLLYVDVVSKLPDGVDVDGIVKQASKDFDDKVLPGMMKTSGVKSVAEFDANLRGQGSSLRQLRTGWAKDQMAKYFLGEQLNVNEYVSHQEMLDEYLGNKDKYEIKAKVKWEQVMIRFDRSDSRESARKQIVDLGNQLIYGASFEAVAKENSHGYRAKYGGQNDWTTKGSLVLTAVDEAIFSLPVNELSDIVESQDGFHIIRVQERVEEGFTPFIEAQVEIKKQLKTLKSNKAFDKHLETIRAKIPVEYFPLD